MLDENFIAEFQACNIRSRGTLNEFTDPMAEFSVQLPEIPASALAALANFKWNSSLCSDDIYYNSCVTPQHAPSVFAEVLEHYIPTLLDYATTSEFLTGFYFAMRYGMQRPLLLLSEEVIVSATPILDGFIHACGYSYETLRDPRDKLQLSQIYSANSSLADKQFHTLLSDLPVDYVEFVSIVCLTYGRIRDTIILRLPNVFSIQLASFLVFLQRSFTRVSLFRLPWSTEPFEVYCILEEPNRFVDLYANLCNYVSCLDPYPNAIISLPTGQNPMIVDRMIQGVLNIYMDLTDRKFTTNAMDAWEALFK